MTQVQTVKLTPIDAQTYENYVRAVLDVFTQTPLDKFSAHDVTAQIRALHPTEFIEHQPAVVHADMLNRIQGGLDYERESVEDENRPGVTYWLYKHINPSAQTIVQTPAQAPAQLPAVGIAVEW